MHIHVRTACFSPPLADGRSQWDSLRYYMGVWARAMYSTKLAVADRELRRSEEEDAAARVLVHNLQTEVFELRVTLVDAAEYRPTSPCRAAQSTISLP